MAEPRLHAGLVAGGPDVAHATVGAGLEVAGKVVVRERKRSQRYEVRGGDEPENNAEPAA